MDRPSILYIEDEMWLMQGVIYTLEEDYHVLQARNADEGLALLESEDNEIALILLDIMMPIGQRIVDANRGRTSGLKFIEELIKLGFDQIPIVCYTVVTDPEIHRKLRELGVKETVTKSRTPEELKEAIERNIES